MVLVGYLGRLQPLALRGTSPLKELYVSSVSTLSEAEAGGQLCSCSVVLRGGLAVD